MRANEYLQILKQAGYTLNEAQAEAVMHREGALLVVAGPGSGKTRVITARVGALLASGVNPAHITVVTFTKAAAAEMKRRIAELPCVGEQLARRLNIGTFHGQFFRVLTRYGFGGSVVQDGQKKAWITAALRKLGEDVKDDLLDSLQTEISWYKNNLLGLQDVDKSKALLRDVWGMYEESKHNAGALDFDDMLCETYRLLNSNKQALHEMQNGAQYLLVDEFQDTNLAQFEVVKLLAAPEINICVVGDIDQAIYSWRAAQPEFLLKFTSHYPQAKRIELKINYRSTPQIISLANRVIANNKLRHAIRIEPVRGGGVSPVVLTPGNERAEAKSILTMVKKLKESGTALEDMAVFYRINRYNHHLVNLLVEENIPFVVRDKDRFFEEHWVVREAMAFLKLAVEPEDIESLLMVGRRQLDMGDEQGLALKRAVAKGAPLWQEASRLLSQDKITKMQGNLSRARRLSPAKALDLYLEDMGFGQYLRWYAKHRGLPEREIVGMCEELQQGMEDYNSISDYLEHTKKLERAMAEARCEEAVPGALNLMTLHAAKGLEFAAVWIIGAVDGLLPHSLAESPEELEEERRLFYVGCTRAKDLLTILAPQKYKGKQTTKSCFVEEGFGKQENATPPATPVPKPKTKHRPNNWPQPRLGMTVKHNTRGFGKIVDISSEQDVGGVVHFVSLEFECGRHKLHWQIALNMGTLEIVE